MGVPRLFGLPSGYGGLSAIFRESAMRAGGCATRECSTALLVVLSLLWSAAAVPAQLGTECQQLWIQRNQAYKDGRYCFKTQVAIDYFSNTGCVYSEQDDVPLSAGDRSLVKKIKDRELYLSCPANPGILAKAAPGPTTRGIGPATSPPGQSDACRSNPAQCKNAIPSAAGVTVIPLQRDGGVFTAPVRINGNLALSFVVDSGAADVSITQDVVLTLIRSGSLLMAISWERKHTCLPMAQRRPLIHSALDRLGLATK
jgi:hypothetical protein